MRRTVLITAQPEARVNAETKPHSRAGEPPMPPNSARAPEALVLRQPFDLDHAALELLLGKPGEEAVRPWTV